MKARILRITQLGEPVLRRRGKRVANPRSASVTRLIADMLVTMRKARGVGIAAHQVGVGLQAFIVAPEPSARYPKAPSMAPVAMLNAKLLKASRARAVDWEGCLSIPGIRARVPRARCVEIEFSGIDGKRYRAQLSGFVARIFQHEFDHVHGRVFLDRVENTRSFMTESEYRKRL
jgi:peptide deformylase